MSPDRPFLCVGAGAIGCLVGGQLFRAGFPTALVGRGPHLEAVRRSGLVLELPSGPKPEGMPDKRGPGPDAASGPGPVFRLPVAAFGSVAEAVAEAGPPAAIVLTVKAFDVEAAAAELAATLPPGSDAPVLCLENGLGSEETVARHIPAERVVAGSVTLSVEKPAPGAVRLLTDQGGVSLAPYRPGPGKAPGASRAPSTPAPAPPDMERAAGPLRLAGFRVRLFERADAVKWSKVLLNLWANATSAVFDAPPERVVADPALFRLDWLAFKEALRVMRRAGIPAVNLPGYAVRLLAVLGSALPEPLFRAALGSRVAGGRGGKMPSLWLDVAAGRTRSEVSFLNGAVAAAGRRLGVPTPANDALARAVENLAAGRVPRDLYARPDGPRRLLES